MRTVAYLIIASVMLLVLSVGIITTVLSVQELLK